MIAFGLIRDLDFLSLPGKNVGFLADESVSAG